MSKCRLQTTHDTHTRTDSLICRFPKLFTVFTARLNSYLTLNLLFEIKAIRSKIEKFIFHRSLLPLNVDGGHTSNIQIHQICGKSVSRFLSFRLSIINLNYTIHKMLTHMESNASVNFSNEMKNSKSRIVNLWLSLSTHLHFSFTLTLNLSLNCNGIMADYIIAIRFYFLRPK